MAHQSQTAKRRLASDQRSLTAPGVFHHWLEDRCSRQAGALQSCQPLTTALMHLSIVLPPCGAPFVAALCSDRISKPLGGPG